MNIGRKTYTVTKTKNNTNKFGQNQTWTDLVGSRGAEVVLLETHHKYGITAALLHLGRKAPWQAIDPTSIRR